MPPSHLHFERPYPKQNSVTRLKSDSLVPQNFWAGYATTDTLAWHYPFRASLFHITHHFYDNGLMPLLESSAHATG